MLCRTNTLYKRAGKKKQVKTQRKRGKKAPLFAQFLCTTFYFYVIIFDRKSCTVNTQKVPEFKLKILFFFEKRTTLETQR